MFNPGTIVECVRNYPYGAGIKKGELAIILSDDVESGVSFDNWPEQGYAWAADSKDFILHTIDLENK